MKLNRKTLVVALLILALLAVAGLAYSRNRQTLPPKPPRRPDPRPNERQPGTLTATGKPRVETAGAVEVTPRPIAPQNVPSKDVLTLVDEAIANGYRPWESSKAKRKGGRGIMPKWRPKNPDENRKWLIEYYTNLKTIGYQQ